MLYMLDTDTCSYLIRENPPSVLEAMDKTVRQGHEVVISSITYAELMLGAKRAANTGRLLPLIQGLCERLHDVCAWDQNTADQLAETQTYLLNHGTPIGANDTLIAAHALNLEATLVTNNTRHFSKVPGLILNNWVSSHNHDNT